MSKAIRDITKSNARPRPEGTGEPVLVRLQPKLASDIDDWRRRQEDLPSRAEALRRLAEATLQILAKDPGENPARNPAPRAGASVAGKIITAAGLAKQPRKSSEMAGEVIDRLIDQAAPAEERARRKRRLIKGPSEFREMRGRKTKA